MQARMSKVIFAGLTYRVIQEEDGNKVDLHSKTSEVVDLSANSDVLAMVSM